MSAYTSSLRSALRAAPRAAPARSFSSSSARAGARMNITGRLGADPELVTSQAGVEYVKYLVGANSFAPSANRTTSWFRVKAFVNDNSRDYLLNTVKKGTLVSVDAEATMRKYTAPDGSDQYSLSLVQRQLEILRRPYNPSEGGAYDAEQSQE
ncbi:single-stranded DNA-binding protein [Aspergillus mulundensis]|uniref:SsDNA binding protein n=1 Tax=Aspergillus mulundensis TaxID=1810919 RepID=A0A3D8RJU1_9EURO|nr:hypothetical protein DSM5745_06977 [Aspergillus mulundensis]RDW74315.1 hypothetical protein DSM5745_06977 [Aspergillus mulundensis]